MELREIINTHHRAKAEGFQFLKLIHEGFDQIRDHYVGFEIQYISGGIGYGIWSEHDLLEIHDKQGFLKAVVEGYVPSYYKSYYKKIHNQMRGKA